MNNQITQRVFTHQTEPFLFKQYQALNPLQSDLTLPHDSTISCHETADSYILNVTLSCSTDFEIHCLSKHQGLQLLVFDQNKQLILQFKNVFSLLDVNELEITAIRNANHFTVNLPKINQ